MAEQEAERSREESKQKKLKAEAAKKQEVERKKKAELVAKKKAAVEKKSVQLNEAIEAMEGQRVPFMKLQGKFHFSKIFGKFLKLKKFCPKINFLTPKIKLDLLAGLFFWHLKNRIFDFFGFCHFLFSLFFRFSFLKLRF